MNVDEVKLLLTEKGISFEEKEFATQRDYWKHASEFWYLEKASTAPGSRRKVLVIPCANGRKDIELEFAQKGGEYELIDLLFGSFAFDVVEFTPEGKTVEETLTEYLTDLMNNRYTVLTVNLKKDGVINDSYRSDVSKADREMLINAYKSANSFIGRLLKRAFVAEVYDRDSYTRVEFNDIIKAERSKQVKRWWREE